MSVSAQGFRHPVLILALAVPVLGAFLVSSGLFTIDELIYLISADALATEGSLTVDNGFSTFGSNDLKLWFLIDGPNGLTPQYPPGLAALSLPFYSGLGAQGLVLVNALAAAGCAALTWALAQKLYRSAAVATVSVLILTFCTFHLDYAWGVWPHMSSAFFVLLAFWLAVRALDCTTRNAVLANAIGSGLAVGMGLLLRADSVLVLPIIAACVLVLARRPVLTLLGGVIGMSPGIAVGAWVNMYKFGTPNVLSYGSTGGDTDITSHLGAILFLGVVLVGLLGLRSVTWSGPRVRLGAVLVLALFALCLVVPQTREVLAKLWVGVMALFVDSRTIVDPRSGVVPGEDGSLLFWGVAKKALFQSLPWLGVLVALVLTRWRAKHVRPNIMLLCFVTVWSLPFVALAWHGGFSSSMRYFLPMLPALVILSSAVIVELGTKIEKPWLIAGLGALGGLGTGLWLHDGGISQTDGFTQQALTLYVFLTVLIVVAVTSVLQYLTPVANAAAMLAVGIGLGTASFASVLVDVSYAQQLRIQTAASSLMAEGLQGPVLIHGSPTYFAFGAARPDVILALGQRVTHEVDVDLFVEAISSGYRALAPIQTAEHVTSETNLTYVDLDLSPSRQWVEIIAAPEAVE